MRGIRTFFLCLALLLPGCGTAVSDVRRNAADSADDAEQRANLARDVQYHVRLAAPETGVPDLDPAIYAAIAEVPRHAFVRGLRYVELEVRQDLLADAAGVERMADCLAAALQRSRT